MYKNSYHTLLGNYIQNIELFNSKPIQKKNSEFYSLQFVDPNPYNNNAVYFIFFTTDLNDTIINVKLSLVNLIDSSFFNTLNLQYGAPDKILITDGMVTENKSVKGSFGSTIIERVSDLREGSFEEHPVLISWKKDDFEITVSMNYIKNQTEITFKNS